MSYFTTLSIVVLLAISGQAIADNATAFSSALVACRTIDRLVKEGATDSDTDEIKRLFVTLDRVHPSLTNEQQRVLWNRYPYFSGIACNWYVGQRWEGNDCEFQCGTLEECQRVELP